MARPAEVLEAELVDHLCQRYGCLPSRLMREDSYVLWVANVLGLAAKKKG